MRVLYIPSDKIWLNYYASISNQHGAGFTAASPYQRGYGLGSLFKHIFRAILPVARSVGKAVGRQALSSGANIASDIVAGKSLKESAETHGRDAASTLLKKAARKIQKGKGLGKRDANKKNTEDPAKGIKRKRAKTETKPKAKRIKKEDQFGFYYE